MINVRPFAAVRPRTELAAMVAALPYDVMSEDEARSMASGNLYSFLHVDRPEIDFPAGTDPHGSAVYEHAAQALQQMITDGVLVQDESPCLYLYRQVMAGRVQTGIVCCADIVDYINGIIKKHELTRADKEADRIRHVDACNAHTGPIFLTYRDDPAAEDPVKAAAAAWQVSHEPVYDFTQNDVRHTVWVIDDEACIDALIRELDALPALYIADGHHRAAAAVSVGSGRKTEESRYFLSVIFPGSELTIMDYNRVVADLDGLTEGEFLTEVSEKFDIERCGGPYRPERMHTFGMYLRGSWYRLTAHEDLYDEHDPVSVLDVTILQDHLLGPVLRIGDPRTDRRIDFVGGIRGLGELETRVNAGEAAAFAMYPTAIEQVMDIADAGLIMPPKSTWFEPKLLSGLFVHPLG